MKPTLRKIILSLAFLAVLGGGLFFAQHALSVTGPLTVAETGIDQVGVDLGMPATDIRLVVARIIRVALGFLGIVALALILYGGFVWMTAGGNEENIQKAKKILTNAVIGLVIILSAYAIVSFVINALIGATTTGGGQGGGGGPVGGYSRVFYVTSMPGKDFGCGARNLHPIIRFNQSVDISTIADNLVLIKKSDGSRANGAWAFHMVGDKPVTSAIVFNPSGDCGVVDANSQPVTDCLDASTTYQIFFANSTNIRSQAPDNLTLNCNVGDYQNQCKNTPSVEFTTGDGVDMEPPTISIRNPSNNDSFGQGESIEVDVDFTDNFGLQDMALFVNNNFDVPVDTAKPEAECQKSGSATMFWPTGSSPTGTYVLTAQATDIALHSATDTRRVILRPAHCFDNVKDPDEDQVGPPACGINSACGYCGGGKCTNHEDCASGWCDNGICVERIKITKFDPMDGAASSTYVTISGQYFGENGGHVYFTKQGGGWTEAFVVNCGAGIDNWTPWQIVVKVPPDADTDTGGKPIKVVHAMAPADGSDSRFMDITEWNDGWGFGGYFKVTDELKPGLCALLPNSGGPYSDTLLLGENFGPSYSTGDDVFFSSSTALIRSDASNRYLWYDNRITARVPSLGTGPVAVKLANNGTYSNAVRFDVREVFDPNAPMIESINPEEGAKGEYITISGKNFGDNLGEVWFKRDGTNEGALPPTAENGMFDFPADCKGATWSDKQIIVKFPKKDGDIGNNYTVQIKRSNDGVIGPIGAKFTLQGGDPAPGICKISPNTGPVPFAPGSYMKLSGEYFKRGNTTSTPYLWSSLASPTSTDGRLPAVEIAYTTDERSESRPPTTTETGPVAMYRSTDDKLGNSLPFTVYDCVQSGNKCAQPNMQCCTGGTDAGICKPNGELCAGQTRSTGYMWHFNTGPFPPTARVLERCDAMTDAGRNLPSPSPDILWTAGGNADSFNVCRTALINIEFTMEMDQTTVNSSNIEIYKCSDTAVSSTFYNIPNSCNRIGGPLLMNRDSYDLNIASGDEFGTHSYISMFPTSARWDNNSFYQVILKDGIKSTSTSYIYKNIPRYLGPQNLKASRPCGDGTAYCFIFKTDDRDCRLNKVIVTPYEYWTAILEAPIKYRAFKSNSDDPGTNLYYKGNGLSDQHCIMMYMGGYDWSWATQNILYAETYDPPAGLNGNKMRISAKANTVAVGLTDPPDAVNILATAATTTASGYETKTGASPLTIDLSKPRVVDYWPKCLEACTNAEIGAKFNIIMSNRNISSGAVSVFKCLDENCSSTEAVSGLTKMIDSGDARVLRMFSLDPSVELATNSLYLVKLSKTGTSTGDQLYQMWSGASLIYQNLFSKPMQTEFIWRFRTKAEKCTLDHVNVAPALYQAVYINDRRAYSAEARSAPDACDPNGQRLNAWGFPWAWQSTQPAVATVQQFVTKGQNPACASNCTKKGSDIAFGEALEPLCGNSKIEAGEDCDPPAAANGIVSCSLNCLRPGNTSSTCGNGVVEPLLGEECDRTDPATKNGCTINCIHGGSQKATGAEDIGASICGNGMLGNGEDCDLGVPANINVSNSALNCSPQCTHLGASLSALWCASSTLPVQERYVNIYNQLTGLVSWYTLDAADVNPLGRLFDKLRATPRMAPIPGASSISYNQAGKLGQAITLTGNAFFEIDPNSGYVPVLNPRTICAWARPSTVASGSSTIFMYGSPLNSSAFFIGRDGRRLVGGGYQNDVIVENFWQANVWHHICLVYNGYANLYADGMLIIPPVQKIWSFTKFFYRIGSQGSLGGAGAGADFWLGSIDDVRVYNTPLTADQVDAIYRYGLANGVISQVPSYGGFSTSSYLSACALSKSQCGDGVTAPGEDAACEAWITASGTLSQDCTASCLANSLNFGKCVPTSTITVNNPYYGPLVETFKTEGCNESGQYEGSSLMYSEPSVCGDGIPGKGEDPICENNFIITHTFIDPWTLAIGVGAGNPTGEPPAQSTDIVGTGTQTIGTAPNAKTYIKSGQGKFEILCGYHTDAECKAALDRIPGENGAAYGVAANSCCYLRPSLISTYPARSVGDEVVNDICPNTYIEAKFDKIIDANTLAGGVLIARGYNIEASGTSTCPAGQTDVTRFIPEMRTHFIADAASDPWYKRLWKGIAGWFARLFGIGKASAIASIADYYCVGGGESGTPTILTPELMGVNSTSSVVINLKKPLATSSDYAILIRPGVKDVRGVSVGDDISWRFITGEEICEVNNVAIDPAEYMFKAAGSSTVFSASTTAVNGQRLQPVDGYRWEFEWGPMINEFVTLENTTSSVNLVTAKNRNGELDMTATLRFTENIFFSQSPTFTGSSHIVVFLCDNPWPSSSAGAFPFVDEKYDFSSYYCMDYGTTGFADDLPYVTSSAVWGQAVTYLKRYIFINSDNKDAIGLQIFSNDGHLSVRDWFASQGFTGNFNSVKIDGYEAITDGNNYYIDALKMPNASGNSIFSNIYQFSINSDATAETKDIFKQMMTNLSFNRALKNNTFCAEDYLAGNIDYGMSCASDLDCLAQMEAIKAADPQSTKKNYICQNAKDKVQHNYQRLKDLRQMISDLNYGRGIVALWSMDSANYGKIPDISLRGYDGVPTGSAWSIVSGIDGQALQIDSPAYMEVQKPTDIGNRSFTLALWVKTTSTGDVYSNLDLITSGKYNNGYRMGLDTNGQLTARIGHGADDSSASYNLLSCPSSPKINDGNWHHLAVVFFRESSARKMQGYIDGNFSCSESNNLPHPAMREGGLPYYIRIGQNQNPWLQSQRLFRGALDDVRIYARPLSVDEIKDLAAHSLPYKGGYPLVKTNTYLSGQAISTWTDAWGELSSEAGTAMPVDPINKLVQSGSCFQPTNGVYKACYKDSDCAIAPMANRVSYWSADDGAKDEGSLGNNGAFEGTVGSGAGKGHGKAFEFSGDMTAKVVAGDNSAYNITGTTTVSAWIYPTKKNTATIIKKGGSDENGVSQGGFVLEYSGFQYTGSQSKFNNGTIRFAIFASSTAPVKYYFRDSQTPLALNQWHHIVASIGANKVIYLYIDGQIVTSPTSPMIQLSSTTQQYSEVEAATDAATSSAQIEIGSAFNGLIDNVAYYAPGLSSGGILNLYKSLCILHDSATGWSAEDRRFLFACNTSSLAYRYSYVSSTESFLLRTKLENYGVYLSPLSNINGVNFNLAPYSVFINSFASSSVLSITNGVCAASDEIASPYNNNCGDGIIGNNEACDPPGKTEYNLLGCPGGMASRTICSKQCQWVTDAISCRTAVGGSCGDGKIQAQAGETCDDGPLNGTNERCNTSCSGIVNNCGNGVLNTGEFCDKAIPKPNSFPFQGAIYALLRENSCNFNCMSYGPYCGDGIVQEMEDCEKDMDCSIGGMAGKRYCTSCKGDNSKVANLIGFWNLDALFPIAGTFKSSANNSIIYNPTMDGTCTSSPADLANCPDVVQGVNTYKKAFSFSGGVLPKGLMINDANSPFDTPSSYNRSTFTIEAWIKPASGNQWAARILEKGGWQATEGGFGIEFNRAPGVPDCSAQTFAPGYSCNPYATRNIRCLTWINGSTYSAADTADMTIDAWHHIACVFASNGSPPVGGVYTGTLKAYLDGNLVSTRPNARLHGTNYPLCIGGKCYKSPAGTYYLNTNPSGNSSFYGTIQDLGIYNVAVSAEVIKSHYDSFVELGSAWYCSGVSSAASSQGTCGNGEIEEFEKCDTGAKNGVPCTFGTNDYRTSCTYCSYDCRNYINISR